MKEIPLLRPLLLTLLLWIAIYPLQSLANTADSTAFPSLMLTWNLTTIMTKNQRYLLDEVIGSASKGRIHAILGPSGSGKTTLLNTLSQEISTKGLEIRGQVYATKQIDPVFIQQEDLLFPQLTVEETLTISERLRRPASSSLTEWRDRRSRQRSREVVNRLLIALGLKNARDTKVGDSKTRGLSGGEKKRLAIGNEITDADVTDGAFIFADEPTTGLDCFQAEKVMTLLHSLASNGSAVLCSIHQPRASIMRLFHDITILSQGKVMYSGPVEDMVTYFSSLGFPCPPNDNPAEYYVDLVSVDYSSPEEERRSLDRIDSLAREYRHRFHTPFREINQQFLHQLRQSHSSESSGQTPTIVGQRKNSWLTKTLSHIRGKLVSLPRRLSDWLAKFNILYRRAVTQIVRDKSLNIARLMSSLFSALLFGSIYYKLSNADVTVPDRLGLLQVAAVNTAMTSLIKATTSFVTEKLIIQRERKRGSYDVFTYFVAKMLAEIPFSSFYPVLFGVLTYFFCGLNPLPGKLFKFIAILVVEAITSTSLGMAVGSIVPTVESGIAVSPAVMVIFIVFGGLYVVNAPAYLQWIKEISLIRWAFEGLTVNEFSDLKLTAATSPSKIADVVAGEVTLQRMGFSHTIAETLKAQLAITLFNYLFTCISLTLQNPQRASKQLLKQKSLTYFYGSQQKASTSSSDHQTTSTIASHSSSSSFDRSFSFAKPF
eukprot:gene12287-13438_t